MNNVPEQQKVGVPGEDRDEDDDESGVEHEYDRQHHRLVTPGVNKSISHKHLVMLADLV